MDNRDDLDVVLVRADALERANDALRARNAELEARLAPKAPLSEEEQARQRLEDAVKRERDEALARERAKRDEEELRELAKNRVAANVLQRRDADRHDDAARRGHGGRGRFAGGRRHRARGGGRTVGARASMDRRSR